MKLVNEDNIQKTIEYIRTHESPFTVLGIANGLSVSPLDVIAALLRDDCVAARSKYRSSGVRKVEWERCSPHSGYVLERI